MRKLSFEINVGDDEFKVLCWLDGEILKVERLNEDGEWLEDSGYPHELALKLESELAMYGGDR